MASFSKTFNFNFRRDHQKNFLWASRLWVCRQKEPILGYVPKKYERNNSGRNGLKKIKIYKLFNPFPPSVPVWHRLAKHSILILERIIKKNFLWSSRLWVGWRKEPILGYVPENYERKNSGSNGLRHNFLPVNQSDTVSFIYRVAYCTQIIIHLAKNVYLV